MIRYSFANGIVEPDEEGRWVKHSDVANIETDAVAKAEALMAQTSANERATIQEQAQQITALSENLALAITEAQNARQDLEARVERQRFMLKAAKDRLKLLGHSPSCFSRYGEVSASGEQAVNACNCGLDDWLKESGVANG